MPIKLQIFGSNALDAGVDVLAVCMTSDALTKQPVVRALDKALAGGVSDMIAETDFEPKPERTLELATLGKIKARRVVVIGVGDKQHVSAPGLRVAAAVAARSAQAVRAKSLAFVAPAGEVDYRAVGEGLVLGAYRFTKYLTQDRRPKRELSSVSVHGKPSPASQKALELGAKVAQAVTIARDAVNEPPNELVPETLAQWSRRVAKQGGLRIKVLDKAAIEKAGMKLHYAVGQGSVNEPRFIHMTYVPGRPAKKKLAFVGKGLTFDSGGLCIKPAPGMGEMKSDMGGAAAVLGLMAALPVIKPNLEVHGIIGAAENMPDAAAYRPGDIFGSLNGKTVEIINTDAEGRLVLADALTYASRLKPDLIVDAATLTGACVVALGKTCSAFYTATDELADQLSDAATAAGEQFWRMPLIEELSEQLKTDVADLKHTGDRWGGSITAALFLREFVEECAWIHCDVAGPVLADRASGIYPKGGTGHPVLTFLKFVESLAG